MKEQVSKLSESTYSTTNSHAFCKKSSSRKPLRDRKDMFCIFYTKMQKEQWDKLNKKRTSIYRSRCGGWGVVAHHMPTLLR